MHEAAARPSEAERVELWFMDEARIGQKGRVAHVRYQKGVRPRGVHEHRFASAHLFGAVCPVRDTGVALVPPEVSTAAMDVFLTELAAAGPAGTHAVLVLGRAGWHLSGDLRVPANLTLAHLPPCSPELDLVERVWLYRRERWLSHRLRRRLRGRARRRLRGLERPPGRTRTDPLAHRLSLATLVRHHFVGVVSPLGGIGRLSHPSEPICLP